MNERDEEIVNILMDIQAKSRFEREHPTGMYLTCLSLIEKAAAKAEKLVRGESVEELYGEALIKVEKCNHAACTPHYDPEQMRIDAETMDVASFQKKYPRFDGYCLECGTHLIAYASYDHYLMGSW